MSANDRNTLVLALALTPGIGSKTIAKSLVRHDLYRRTPREFLTLPEEVLVEEYRLKKGQAARWVAERTERWSEAERVREELVGKGVRVVTAADDHYPTLLEGMDSDPPGVLFYYGNERLLNTSTFTVLASRGGSEESMQQIERMTEDGVLAGETLVIGHDTPEYQRAAVVPLRWGAPRILVFDTGFIHALGEDLTEEPFRAARLWRYSFDPRTDLVVSAVPPDRVFHLNGNKVRDRLVAGLSRRLDFAYLAPGRNMERVLISALRAGRPVRVAETVPNYDAYLAQGAGLVFVGDEKTG
ncbi:MAG: DNA-processing protein DprA [Fimbriimonadaceae bacterium]|nr:DNA-processing protein DprA [Fimbriimonadaceae bacterium]